MSSRAELLERLAYQAKEMREAQREWFGAEDKRSAEAKRALGDSKRLERAVDDTLEAIEAAARGPVPEQTELF